MHLQKFFMGQIKINTETEKFQTRTCQFRVNVMVRISIQQQKNALSNFTERSCDANIYNSEDQIYEEAINVTDVSCKYSDIFFFLKLPLPMNK